MSKKKSNQAKLNAGSLALWLVLFYRFGIRCNAVLPGFIQTPMTDAVPDKVLEKVIVYTHLCQQYIYFKKIIPCNSYSVLYCGGVVLKEEYYQWVSVSFKIMGHLLKCNTLISF